MDRKKRCVIYVRVSTQDQDLENQLVQLRNYASNQDWEIVDEISDFVSGAKSLENRNGLKDVFSKAHKREYDVLLFWALDRFSREGSRKTLEYLTQLDSYHIGWHSFTEQYISSVGIFSDAIISLLSAIAKQERIRISERTRAGLDRVRKMGKKLGRPKFPNEIIDKARLLRENGLSYESIGKALNISRGSAFQFCKVN